MSKKTEVTITCDYCKQPIKQDTNYIDASAYGADFHVACVVADMTAMDMLIALGLDDITYSNGGDKVIYYLPLGEHR